MDEPCLHQLIEHIPDDLIAGRFVCSDCGVQLVLRTKSGHIITIAEMDRWIDEAISAASDGIERNIDSCSLSSAEAMDDE